MKLGTLGKQEVWVTDETYCACLGPSRQFKLTH